MNLIKNRIVNFFVLFFLGCTEYSQYTIEKSMATLVPHGCQIDNAEEIPWKVGKNLRKEVSKGFVMKFSFPALDSEAIEDLRKRDVDAWLVRVTQEGSRGYRVLGHVYYPVTGGMGSAGRSGGSSSSGGRNKRPVEAGAVSVFYAAAAMSERFVNFGCPAFDHRKKIDELSLQRPSPLNNTTGRKVLISNFEESSFRDQVEEFSLRPAIFNAEMILAGKYTLDVAFYDHRNRIKKSAFFPIEGVVVVETEKEIPLSECASFKVPPSDP